MRAVLLGADGEATWRGPRVNRWTEAPAVALVGARPGDRVFVSALLARFASVLGPHAARLAESGSAAARIGVYFVARDEAAAVAARHRMRTDLALRGAGYTEAAVGPRHALRMVAVLVRDELEGRERRATIAHELYHALGPGGHSRWIPGSVVFDDSFASSFATAPAPVDLKTLALLYRHLRPGDDEAAVRAAFDAHWAALDAPSAAE